jgi:hypothetical protein
MNPGNAAFGFLLVVGLALEFGWPVALIAVPLLLELLLGRGIKSKRNFRYLDPLEQALRRASQGWAVMVFSVLAAVVPYVWLYGWHDFFALGPWITAHPEEAWPLGLLPAAFMVGFLRFRSGVRRSAGTRDDIQGPKGFFKCAAGLLIVGYLTFTYPTWNAFAYQPDGTIKFLGVVAIYAAGLWCVLVGGMRALLLSLPRRSAVIDVQRDINRQFFDWR